MALTEAGLVTYNKELFKFYINPNNSSLYHKKSDPDYKDFCSHGKYNVKISDFSTPAEGFGRISSEVYYTVTATYDDEWANSPEIRNTFQKAFSQHLLDYEKDPYHDYYKPPYTAYVIKTNNGWKVSSLIR